jgi:hypothetical protein
MDLLNYIHTVRSLSTQIFQLLKHQVTGRDPK